MRKPQRSSRAAVYRAVTGSVERPSCRGSVTSFFVGANQSLAPPLLLPTRGRQPTGRTPSCIRSATMPVEFDLTGLHDEHTIRANVPPPLSDEPYSCLDGRRTMGATREALKTARWKLSFRKQQQRPVFTHAIMFGKLFGGSSKTVTEAVKEAVVGPDPKEMMRKVKNEMRGECRKVDRQIRGACIQPPARRHPSIIAPSALPAHPLRFRRPRRNRTRGDEDQKIGQGCGKARRRRHRENAGQGGRALA